MVYRTHSNDWIVLFGGGGRDDIVATMREHGYNVTRVLAPQKTNLRLAESIIRLQAAGLPVEVADRQSAQNILRTVRSGQLLSVGWPHILDRDVLERHEIALNVHPTLLPKFAGPTSGAYVILEGEKETGSTVHLMTPEPDGGAILAQSRVTVGTFDTLRSMQRRVYQAEPQLVCETLKRLSAEGIVGRQPERGPDFRPPRTPEASLVDPSQPLIELYDEIRASDSDAFPAHFFLEGQKVCIKLWREERSPDEEDMV